MAETATPDWQAILRAEIASDKRGKAGVAARIGVGRAYVSRVIATLEGRPSGFASGVPEDFVRRVLALVADVDCPATGERQPRADCARALDSAPIHNPNAMRIWRVCQTCIFRPVRQVVSPAGKKEDSQ